MMTFIYVISVLLYSLKLQSLSYDFHISKENKAPLDLALYLSFLSTEPFCLGTPFQCVRVQFDPSTSLLVIQDKFNESNLSFDSGFPLYNKSNSLTYSRTRSSSETYSGQKVIEGLLSADKMKFGEFQLENGSFYLSSNWVSGLDYSSIGLSSTPNDESFPNLITKLLKADLIKKHRYTIEFIDDFKGVVTFGTNTTRKKYKSSFSLKAYRYYVGSYFRVERLTLTSQNSQLYGSLELIFDESFKYILMPSTISENILDSFLNGIRCDQLVYKPQRASRNSSKYLYYICSVQDIESKQSALSDLDFVSESSNLTLRKEDLFGEYDDKRMIFNIVFREDKEDPQWIIGRPILKYFTVHRDLDQETVTFYHKEKDKVRYWFDKSAMVILCVILVSGLCFIQFALCKMKSVNCKDEIKRIMM